MPAKIRDKMVVTEMDNLNDKLGILGNKSKPKNNVEYKTYLESNEINKNKSENKQ